MKNCVYYCFYGNKQYLDLLDLSLKSLNLFFNKEDIIVFSDRALPQFSDYARVIIKRFPEGHAIPMAYRLMLGSELLEDYDRVLHLDIDTIVTGNIDNIFDFAQDEVISFAWDNIPGVYDQVIGEYWAGPLMSHEERYNYHHKKSICCGVFLFNKSSKSTLEKIYEYVCWIESTGYKGPCYDQHAFSTYVVKNNCYNYNLQIFVTHSAKDSDFKLNTDFIIHHFAGGVTSENKYEVMLNVYHKLINKSDRLQSKERRIKVINSRNELLDFLPKGMVIAELGVFKGEFSDLILEKTDPSELFLIDLFPSDTCSGDKDGNNVVSVNLEEYYDSFVEKFKDNLKVKIIKDYTTNFLNSLEDEYLDAVYIDADHSYESVKKDLELSYVKVKLGGIIMGHDYNQESFPGVVRAVDEFCDEYNLKISCLTLDGCPTYLIFKT